MLRRLLIILCVLGTYGTASAQEPQEQKVPFTLSVFGPISTNPLSYERTTSNFCVGLINCANLNVYGFTGAYGYNRVYNDMYGISLGFGGNIVSNEGRGIEAGLLFNINLGDFRGLQLASLNVTGASHSGVQAGLLNYAHERFAGLQLSALNLVIGESKGAQIGYINYAHGQVSGLQFSLLNVGSDKVDGVQAAVLNVSDETVEGLQLGMLNIVAGEDSESRMAVQFGLVNVSNQAQVIPIGLINFVRGGRFNLEINRDVLGFNNLSVATGSQYFYGIWILDSRDINPGKRDLYHEERLNPWFSGWGIAYPIQAQTSIKLERLVTWATNFDRDEALVVRMVGEFAPSSYFQYHAGLEQISWVEKSENRSSVFKSYGQRTISLTAGISFNLLGWWKSPN